MAAELRASIGKLTGDPQQDVKVMYNYVMQLTEELRYAMNNIGIGNLNDKELARYENGRLQIYAKTVDVKTQELRVEIEASEKELRTQIKANSDGISQIVESVGRDGAVTAASIVLAINEASDESEVLISADKIDLKGVVTLEGLEKGETVISGDYIKSGTIEGTTITSEGPSPEDPLYMGYTELGNGRLRFRNEGNTDAIELYRAREGLVIDLPAGLKLFVREDGAYREL